MLLWALVLYEIQAVDCASYQTVCDTLNSYSRYSRTEREKRDNLCSVTISM
jgi:hypothetical protein